jgi:hypothetical protein
VNTAEGSLGTMLAVDALRTSACVTIGSRRCGAFEDYLSRNHVLLQTMG